MLFKCLEIEENASAILALEVFLPSQYFFELKKRRTSGDITFITMNNCDVERDQAICWRDQLLEVP